MKTKYKFGDIVKFNLNQAPFSEYHFTFDSYYFVMGYNEEKNQYLVIKFDAAEPSLESLYYDEIDGKDLVRASDEDQTYNPILLKMIQNEKFLLRKSKITAREDFIRIINSPNYQMMKKEK